MSLLSLLKKIENIFHAKDAKKETQRAQRRLKLMPLGLKPYLIFKLFFMKRYIFGLLAVVTAISAVAFKQPEKKLDKFVFQFNGSVSGGYTVPNVENEANTNWVYQGKNLSLCGGQDEKACRVAVLAAYVDDPANPTELKDLTITATMSGSTAHVTGITDPSANQISNQPD